MPVTSQGLPPCTDGSEPASGTLSPGHLLWLLGLPASFLVSTTKSDPPGPQLPSDELRASRGQEPGLLDQHAAQHLLDV